MSEDETENDGNATRSAPAGNVPAAVGAGCVTAVVVGLPLALEDVPWGLTAALALAAAVGAGLTGWRTSRRESARNAVLEPGERVLNAYVVRPTYTGYTPPSPSEGPQYVLRSTTRGLEMWERDILLWRHPWTELRVVLDGQLLRVQHLGEQAGVMRLERQESALEVTLTARRYRAG
ncbi:hypothetical protein [Streptomyces sp. NPDC060198]|uniref:hypothetical protein n=1 Tax=Streptomyces sp. NPDC060198 TaxID=3347070 RepID=UPI0036649B1B